MSDSTKVIWKEGMFVTPQHFQQQERYLRWYIDHNAAVSSSLRPRAGLIAMEINHDLGKVGKFAISGVSGVFPGGGFFVDDEELVIQIPPGTIEKKVFLCLPVARKGGPEYLDDPDAVTQYTGKEVTVFDNASDDSSSVQLLVGQPNLQLRLEGEDLSGFLLIPVARVLQTSDTGEVILDESFLPMCMVFGASTQMVDRIKEIETLTQSRARNQLAKITAEVNPNTQHVLFREYMLLQTLYRWAPWLCATLENCRLDTHELYINLCRFNAELASLEPEDCPEIEYYDPADCFGAFNLVLSSLRERLTLSQQDSVVEFQFNRDLFQEHRLLRASIGNPQELLRHRFFLSVTSDDSREHLQDLFANVAKVAGAKKISELIRSSLSGVDLTPLPAAPPELKPDANAVYFRIDTDSPIWRELVKNQDLVALHVDTRIPNPTVRFFAIR